MSTKIHLIKELRNRTGAGILDCKEAILNNDSDIEKSVIWLRKKRASICRKKKLAEILEKVLLQ